MAQNRGQGPQARSDNVRARIADAVIGLVSEQGYDAVDRQMIIERAGVDSAQFAQYFAGKEDCFIEVYDEQKERFIDQVYEAYQTQDAWRDRLRAAAYAAARFMREYPREIRIGTVGILAASELARVHQEHDLDRLVDLIDAGRQELEDPESMSRADAVAVIGSILAAMNSQQKAGTLTTPEQTVPGFMYLAVLPYLGQEAAEEELQIPPPPSD
jgi:AcrR family transcriptional regulator